MRQPAPVGREPHPLLGGGLVGPDDQVVAVNEMNLDIPDGEFVVFVGPSGCGKSTLLRMVGNLHRPSSGAVRIITDHPRPWPTAMVFQDYGIFPWKTVEANIAFWTIALCLSLAAWLAFRRFQRELADFFAHRELFVPELLELACKEAGIPLTLRRRPGYDHSYYFISTFMADHLRWHAERLGS